MASLKELGRLHTAQEALDAVAVARSIFERYSFDLIYARPRQTLDAWDAELKRAIAEAAEHLSLYQLTIEPGTPFFGLHKAGKLVVPDDDLGRDLYDLTQQICASRRPARLRDLQPRAAGRRVPAQSGLLARPRICRHRAGRAWPPQYRRPPLCHRNRKAAGRLAAAGRGHKAHGLIIDERLTSNEVADEFLLMGLRLAEGIEPARFTALAGRDLDPKRDFISARRRHGRDHRRRPPARDAGRISVARCGGRRSWRLNSSLRARQSERPRTRGGGLTTCPPFGVTRSTARPRSLVPSGRKRKMPSMPAKPEGEVSVCSLKRCGPGCCFTSAATSATAS